MLNYDENKTFYDVCIELIKPDYVITAENKTIKCHKNMLDKIDYFNKLFMNDWNDNGNKTIIENYIYATVSNIIKYIMQWKNSN